MPKSTPEQDERRHRRAAAQLVFDEIADDQHTLPEVSRAVMFGSNGLRWRGKFFAFVGGEGELIVKIPAADAAALVESGRATAIKTGRQTTREWVGVPADDSPAGRQQWRELLAASQDFVKGLGTE